MLGTFTLPPRINDPDMHHGTCVTHVLWCMPGSLTSGFLWSRRREAFPPFPVHAQPAILRIWQEAHDLKKRGNVLDMYFMKIYLPTTCFTTILPYNAFFPEKQFVTWYMLFRCFNFVIMVFFSQLGFDDATTVWTLAVTKGRADVSIISTMLSYHFIQVTTSHLKWSAIIFSMLPPILPNNNNGKQTV